MIGDFKNWVSAFLDWNIVLDQRGGPNHVGNFCDAPVIVNTATKQITYTPAYYYIAHFSKFINPGAHRIKSEGGPAQLQSIAFENPDGALIVVVLNASDVPATFELKTALATLACRIPPRAIQTYVSTKYSISK